MSNAVKDLVPDFIVQTKASPLVRGLDFSRILDGKALLSSVLKLRNRHFLMLDAIAIAGIPILALTLRLDRFDWWSQFGPGLILFTLLALLVKVPVFGGFGLYKRYWRYASVNDLTPMMVAVGLSTLILSVVVLIAQAGLASFDLIVPRTLPVIDGMLTGLAVGGFRFGLRGFYYWYCQRQDVVGGRRVLIVGAGEAGMMVAREMRANPQLGMEPVAFVDDDPAKLGTHVHGLPVLGSFDLVPRLVDQFQIQQIVVAIPSSPLVHQREIIAMCEKTGIVTHNLPGVYQILAGHKTISYLPEIDVDRLLRRDPVVTDQAELDGVLKGATVLVTGAGGSIGSELCRQIARFDPAEIILLGHGENSIFEIGLNLRILFPNVATRQVIVDVRNQQRVEWVIDEYRPEIIFHAAAHKHVPFMEDNVEEAVSTNIMGTRNLLQAAERYGVERFVLISTDKAVNPTSIMGSTKRMAELLVVATAQRSNRAYMAVRFGNVLGSRGSVIPIFQRQIAAGGPLTVTHPDMTRYFMTIPEAVQLVLQAGAVGQGGEVFVLDMGGPVRIVDLATDMLDQCGLEPERDIEIVYSGIRPGEKLYEELFLEGEHYQRTRHSKVFMATQENRLEAEALEQVVNELVALTQHMGTRDANQHMRLLIPKVCFYLDSYRPQPWPSLAEASAVATIPAPQSLHSQPSPATA
jgi:FlaA1/EpsC-like NDP-sugar epimerase